MPVAVGGDGNRKRESGIAVGVLAEPQWGLPVGIPANRKNRRGSVSLCASIGYTAGGLRWHRKCIYLRQSAGAIE